ncbi:MAG: TolC family protein [Fibrobacter sp.]|nr:TolC family protein [Fibrobacter sp.]
MRRLLLMGFMVAAVSPSGAEEQPVMTLEQCIESALSANAKVVVADEKLIEKEAAIKEAATGFLPKLSGSGSVSVLLEAPSMIMEIPMMPVQKIQTSARDNYSVSASFTQPLFAGGKIVNGYRIAEQARCVSEWQLKAARKDVTRDVTQAYYTVTAARKSLVALDTSIALLEQIVKDLKNAVEVGMRGEHELLQAEVQLQNQKMVRQQAANGVTAARGRLAVLIGKSINEPVNVTDSIVEPVSFDLPELESLIGKIGTEMPELKQMDHQLRILELSAKIAGSAYWPMLFTAAGFSGQVIGIDDREFQDSWSLSLALKWDIFDWGAALQKKKQMLSQARQLNTTKEEITKNMELAVKTGYLAVKDAFDNIAITRKSIEQSRRAYDITYDKFGQGVVPNSELMTAQSTMLQSEIAYYKSLSDYYSKRADIEYLFSSK